MMNKICLIAFSTLYNGLQFKSVSNEKNIRKKTMRAFNNCNVICLCNIVKTELSCMTCVSNPFTWKRQQHVSKTLVRVYTGNYSDINICSINLRNYNYNNFTYTWEQLQLAVVMRCNRLSCQCIQISLI